MLLSLTIQSYMILLCEGVLLKKTSIKFNESENISTEEQYFVNLFYYGISQFIYVFWPRFWKSKIIHEVKSCMTLLPWQWKSCFVEIHNITFLSMPLLYLTLVSGGGMRCKIRKCCYVLIQKHLKLAKIYFVVIRLYSSKYFFKFWFKLSFCWTSKEATSEGKRAPFAGGLVGLAWPEVIYGLENWGHMWPWAVKWNR